MITSILLQLSEHSQQLEQHRPGQPKSAYEPLVRVQLISILPQLE